LRVNCGGGPEADDPLVAWLATNAPGTLTRISSTCVMHAPTEPPAESASFTSALLRHGSPCGSPTWPAVVVPPFASTAAAASRSRENRDEGSSPGGRGCRPFFPAEQEGVAARVAYPHLAAKCVRRAAHMVCLHPGRLQRPDDSAKIGEVEEGESSGSCGTSSGGRVEVSSTRC